MYDLLIKNGTLVTKDGMFQADVAVKNEKYAAFVKQGEDIAAQRTIDAAGMLVFPGIIDCHAHLNEPGYEYREDFETGTRAAASAGCTCLIDMPLNNRPALTDKEAFACKKERALQKSYIDFALWGGIVGAYDENGMRTPANLDIFLLRKPGRSYTLLVLSQALTPLLAGILDSAWAGAKIAERSALR